MLESFHPAVRAWFERRFPDGPTAPQAGGLAARSPPGNDTLIAAPTGSGKTLAAFLVCIDRLLRGRPTPSRRGRVARPAGGVRLAAEGAGRRHPAEPGRAAARRSREVAAELGLTVPGIRVAVRTGDTPPPSAPRCSKRPPDFLVTTPESLYLLVTARAQPGDAARRADGDRRRDPRRRARQARVAPGAHARAARRTSRDGPVQRIGLSATQRPIETDRAAAGRGGRRPVDAGRVAAVHDRRHRPPARARPGHRAARRRARGRRHRPSRWAEILDRIAAARAAAHRTTLVFVNTRRMAERVAHQLGERLGEDQVAAHHGSLSQGPPAAGRGPAAGRRPAGAGGHRLARARHRRRAGRAGLPDRLAAQHRHVPAAGRPVRPHPSGHAHGAAVPA